MSQTTRPMLSRGYPWLGLAWVMAFALVFLWRYGLIWPTVLALVLVWGWSLWVVYWYGRWVGTTGTGREGGLHHTEIGSAGSDSQSEG